MSGTWLGSFPPLWTGPTCYPSALLYAGYGCFAIWGFAVWLKVSHTKSVPAPMPVTTEVGR